jgi:peptide deformylase
MERAISPDVALPAAEILQKAATAGILAKFGREAIRKVCVVGDGQNVFFNPRDPANALRVHNVRVENFSDPNVARLAAILRQALSNKDVGGVGINANQIGVNVCAFAVSIGHCLKTPKLCTKFVLDGEDWLQRPAIVMDPLLCFNAKILKKSAATAVGSEGCLSIDDPNGPAKCLSIMVRRSLKITLQFQDEDGAVHTLEVDGWCARVFQHEQAHDDGELITDHDPFWRNKIHPQRLTPEQEMAVLRAAW